MRKKLAAVGLTAGLAGGAAAGFVFTANSGAVGAQDGTTTTTIAPGEAPKAGERPDPSARFQDALKGLVDDGTITQAQADKVVEALVAAGPAGERGGPGGHGPGGKGGRGGGPGLDLVAPALGMTVDELKAELGAGKTIAQVAEAKGVELSTVVDAVVAGMKERIAQQVTDGRITQAQADERLAQLEENVTARLNGEGPEGGPGGFGGPGPGGHGPGGHGPDEDAPEGN